MNLRRYLMVIVALICAVSVQALSTNNSMPNFNFPDKVTKESESDLKNAIKNKDYPLALRSIINYAVAKSAKSSENIVQTIDLIKSAIIRSDSRVFTSMLQMLEAEMYNSVYQNDKYKYDNRSVSTVELPENIFEWSGKQFRDRIIQLCDSALLPALELKNTPISEYATVLTLDKYSELYYPTLYDFVANQTISNYKQLSPFTNNMSLRLLSPAKVFTVTSHYIPSFPLGIKILDLYADLLRFHVDDVPAYLATDIARIDFVVNGMYYNQRREAEIQQYNLFSALYDEFRYSEYSGCVLHKMFDCYWSFDNMASRSKELYALLTDFNNRYPRYYNIDIIKQDIEIIKRPSVTIETRDITSPGQNLPIKIKAQNVHKAIIKAYRLPDKYPLKDYYVSSKLPISQIKPVYSAEVKFYGSVPFDVDTTVNIAINDYGQYVIDVETPEIKNTTSDKYLSKVYCTDMLTGYMSYANVGAGFVYNPVDGSPVSGADVYGQSNRASKENLIGRTDKNGFININDMLHLVNLRAWMGQDQFSPYVRPYVSRYREGESDYVYANTDLPIYHPGDTVKWVGVLYASLYDKRKLQCGKNVKVTLYNVNDIEVDAVDKITDDFGRVYGSFVIPKGELTGYYRIVFGDYWQGISFMVSDYKMPTFFVECDKAKYDTPALGDVTISGLAKTYSGVGLSNAKVKYTLSVAENLFVGHSNQMDFYSDSVETDMGGMFNVVVPSELIENSPLPNGVFTASIMVMSLSGESQQASCVFSIGKTYSIEAKVPKNINADNPVGFSMKLLNRKGAPVKAPLLVRFESMGKDCIEIVCDSVASGLDIKRVPSGIYNVTVTSVEKDYPADSVSFRSICIYRNDDKHSPSDDVLWTPSDTLTTDNKGAVSILLGTIAPKSHVLYFLSANDSVYEQRWITYPAGLNKLNVRLPDGVDNATVNCIAVYNFKKNCINVSVKRPVKEPKLAIVAESFRDKLVPGALETWTFKTINENNAGTPSAIILDMYNAALDALAQQARIFNPYTQHRPLLKYALYDMGIVSESISGEFILRRNNTVNTPVFNSYGRPFYIRGYAMPRRLYKMVSNTGYVMEDAMEAKSEAVGAVASDAISFVAAEAGEASLNENDAGNSEPEMSAPFKYRGPSKPLAFFNPSLTTDIAGELVFSFQVPEDNATWAFSAIAFNSNLLTSSINASLISNKPIMVQPNLPRFMRVGDDAMIKTLVINNTESSKTVNVNMSAYNLETGTVLTSCDTIVNVAGSGNVCCGINVKAAEDCQFIGVRVKASTEEYSDGEQNAIPVLPNSRPVIDTYPFYIEPDSTKFSLTIPNVEQEQHTLQYCDNPIWYVVTALPGISDSKMRTSTDAANALYSVSVANGLIKTYPGIKLAFDEWSKSDKNDSTLVSMLERNQDLKTILLQATPWMREAQNDTERMQRLSFIFDKKNVEAATNSAVSLLKRLYRDNGGWAWIDECQSVSVWSTEQVLMLLGYLNEMGYMPKNNDLTNMVDSSLSFIETEKIKLYKKYPKSDFTSYVALMDLWPNHRLTISGDAIVKTQLSRMIRDWDKSNVWTKAIYAKCLFRHNYKSVASKILDSLDEFADYSRQRGMWWPAIDDMTGGGMVQLRAICDILSAYSTVRPYSPCVNHIRQWLILQKEARNWADGFDANYVISTILLTSKTWLCDAGNISVEVNGQPVRVSAAENKLGYFKAALPSLDSDSIKVNIDRSGNTPSWGCVYARSNKTMNKIKPFDCGDLSIRKVYYRQNGTEWIKSTVFNVGDKVRTVLTIVANRDMQYMTITDDRSSCMEPAEQTPRPMFSDGVWFYRENRDASTNMFVENMPKGTYVLSYDMFVNNAGEFVSGIANIQSQYAPEISAHSGGDMIFCGELTNLN